jgi:hypothetical protein
MKRILLFMAILAIGLALMKVATAIPTSASTITQVAPALSMTAPAAQTMTTFAKTSPAGYYDTGQQEASIALTAYADTVALTCTIDTKTTAMAMILAENTETATAKSSDGVLLDLKMAANNAKGIVG